MNKNDFTKSPYYVQIRDVIYNKIISGEYKAGDKLPSEDNLAQHFGVSRMTVCKALTMLIDKEYLTRIQGKGTFVSKLRKEGSRLDVAGFNDSMVNKGFTVNTKVFLRGLEIPSKEIVSKLNIPFTQKVLHLKRVRVVNDEPIVVQDTYLNIKLCEELVDIDFEKNPLYESIRNICKKNVVRANDIIEAISAESEISKLLDIKVGVPVLLTKRTAYIENDVPIEFTYSWYRSDQYVLEVEYR